MTSNSGATKVLSCGLALPVLTAMGSPLASIMIMIFTPFSALVQPIHGPLSSYPLVSSAILEKDFPFVSDP